MRLKVVLEPSDEAASRFQQGYNCSQSVFSALAPGLGLEEGTALRIAAPFGGGMGRMGEVCGAVSGALMAIGLKYGATSAEDKAAKERAYTLAAQFGALFQERHGSLLCRTLLGADLSTPEGQQSANEQGSFRTICPRLVHDAAEIAAELLAK